MRKPSKKQLLKWFDDTFAIVAKDYYVPPEEVELDYLCNVAIRSLIEKYGGK